MRLPGLLIDGKIVQTRSRLAVVNPATEEVIAHSPIADVDELDRAVDAAERAQPSWAAKPHSDRQAVLVAIADAIQTHRQALAELVVQEQGKPLIQALGEVAGAEGYTRYYATLELPTRVLIDNAFQRVEEHRQPLGIVAGIVPWNFPLMIAVYKLAPAILVGNAIIIKPSPTTPLSMLLLGELIRELVPPGIVQILSDDNRLGSLITEHTRIAKISFTGSTATGKAIMRSGAGTLKRLTLELGGNDAAIVLDDVDLDVVVPKLFGLAFANSGQVCVAIKRLFVPDGLYGPICERLVDLAEKVELGNGLESGTTMGPVQNKAQFDRVMAIIDAVRSGEGRILTGGDRHGNRGYFITPTIVADVKEGSQLVDEEPFGPVLPVIRYSEVEEVIARANATCFGLGASVWSADSSRATEIAKRLQAGSVWVNQHMALGPNIPLRGNKESGIGTENAIEGLLEYTQAQIVNIALA
jgi:acyl-CoA reductase-like NAD-dependent aldehyde dehydrogenase